MNMKKAAVIAGTVAALGVAGFVGTSAFAATEPGNNLVEKLASKFNLNKDDVQKVFDEDRQARQAEDETRLKEELANLVKAGKINQSQADALVKKRSEMEKQRQNEKPPAKPSEMTDEQRSAHKAEMDKKHSELKSWLKQQGLDESYGRYVMGGLGDHGHHGPEIGTPPLDSAAA